MALDLLTGLETMESHSDIHNLERNQINTNQTDIATNTSAIALKSPIASPTFTGTVTIPTPFTLGAVSVTPTGTELNYVDGVTSSIQTQLNAKAVATDLSDHISDTTTHGTTGAIVGVSDTQTLTNKAITQRVVTTTDDASAVIDCAITDQYELTAVANATTFTVSGTPTDGQKLIIRFKDGGVAKGLTFTGFTAMGVTIPTTTTAGKWGYVGAIYNLSATTWHVVAAVTEA